MAYRFVQNVIFFCSACHNGGIRTDSSKNKFHFIFAEDAPGKNKAGIHRLLFY
jgi:hypothetical protein